MFYKTTKFLYGVVVLHNCKCKKFKSERRDTIQSLSQIISMSITKALSQIKPKPKQLNLPLLLKKKKKPPKQKTKKKGQKPYLMEPLVYRHWCCTIPKPSPHRLPQKAPLFSKSILVHIWKGNDGHPFCGGEIAAVPHWLPLQNHHQPPNLAPPSWSTYYHTRTAQMACQVAWLQLHLWISSWESE